MKRLLSVLLCLVLLLSAVAAASAEGEGVLQVFGYNWTENDSVLEANLFARLGTTLTARDISAELGGNKMNAEQLNAYAGGVSWIVIVEPSGSGTEKDAALDALQELYGKRGQKDTVSVLDAGTCELKSFVGNVKDAQDFAKKAMDGKNKIRLYQAVMKALTEFQSNENYRARKCLLILTRGESESGDYITMDMLKENVDKLEIGVYTIGFNRNNDDKVRTNLEAWGSLTENSGLATEITTKEVKAEEFMFPVRENEANCYTLRLTSAAGFPAGDSAALTLTVDSGLVKASCMQTVSIPHPECQHEWLDATCTEPRTCALCGETEGEPLGHSFSEGSFFKRAECARCGETKPCTWDLVLDWVTANVLVVALGALLLVLLIVLLVMLGKKPKLPQIDTGAIPAEPQPPEPPAPPAAKLTVELTNQQTGEVIRGKIMDKTVVAGRTAPMAITGDPAISKAHVQFIWESGILYAQDVGSTNGTQVNGVEIKGQGPVPLRHNNIMHIGDHDYAVKWHFGD